ncbi:MAG: WD40 repeat domain-containing protein, partial [Armatimonadaceae bacterium]
SAGADRKVVVWNGGGGRIREHSEATSDIWNLAISPNSRWLATACRDGRVRIYDLADGTYVRQLPPPANGAKP